MKCRMPEGWTAPKEIENALSVKWRSTIDAELLIYRENKTGDLRTKVMSEDKDTQLSRMGDSVKEILQTVRSYPLPSRPQISFVGGSSTSATTEAEYIDIKHEDVPSKSCQAKFNQFIISNNLVCKSSDLRLIHKICIQN